MARGGWYARPVSGDPQAPQQPEPPERAAPSAWAYRGSIAALVLGSFLALFLVLRPPESASRAEIVRPASTPAATAAPPSTPVPTATPRSQATPVAATATPAPSTPQPTPQATPDATRTPQPTPAPVLGPIEYTIVAGDTLLDIAISFEVTLDGILELNPELDPDALQIGQIILVPRP